MVDPRVLMQDFGAGLSTLGPPRLFDQAVPGPPGTGWWPLVLGLGAGLLVVVIAARLFRRRLVGDEGLAFRLLARRLGVRGKERNAVERLAQRAGAPPVGLLICESAFVRALRGQSFELGRHVEAKPTLLTGPECEALERLALRLFGERSLDQSAEDADDSHEEAADESSHWVA